MTNNTPDYRDRLIEFARAAAHCEWLEGAETLELIQEITSTDCDKGLDEIAARYRVAVRRGELVDLDMED